MSITAEHPVKCLGVRIVVGRHQRFGGAASWGKNRAPADVVVWMRPLGVVHTMVPSGCWRTVQPVWKVLSR